MAGANRHAADAVALHRRLAAAPEAFELFAALRRLECVHADCPRLGESARPVEDLVRLGQTPSLAFAPRDVDRFQPATDEHPAHLDTLAFGLFGPNGPLPLHLTEFVLERLRHAKDTTLRAFANMFHHRMLSLFYRAWANARPTVQFDRPEHDRFHLYLGALIGLATPGLDGRDALPDPFKRFFAGHLVTQARHAEGLRGLLERFFTVPIRLIEFIGEWMRLPVDAHLRLGRSRETACLGRTAVLGESVRGAQQRFRVRIGPLSQFEFKRFLPGGEAFRQLVAAVKSYVGEEQAWDVQLVLKADEVPATRLGHGSRTGLSTWIGSRGAADGDADQVIVHPDGARA